jgi:hypothetical protein
MRCANPKCRATAENLLKGILKLMEFETPPDERLLYAAGGFPVCSAQTRYFWLCESCSKHLTVKKWNSTGPVLGPLFENSDPLSAVRHPRVPVPKTGPAVLNRSENSLAQPEHGLRSRWLAAPPSTRIS